MRILAALPAEKKETVGNRVRRAQKASKVKPDHKVRRACLVPRENLGRLALKAKRGSGEKPAPKDPKGILEVQSRWRGAIQALKIWRLRTLKGMAATPI